LRRVFQGFFIFVSLARKSLKDVSLSVLCLATGENTLKTDTTSVKKSIDLRQFFARYTQLHRASGDKEQCGPCPKCGGSDRFHCTAAWFFCRQCHPRRGDAIESVQWMGQAHGFKDAVALLGGQPPAAPATHCQPRRQATDDVRPATWLRDATALVENAHQELMEAHPAHPGVVYLNRRGLARSTWQGFRLGYKAGVPLPGTWNGETKTYSHPPQPAIVIPWYHRGRLVAVRYRFLEEHTYTGSDGGQRTARKSSKFDSKFGGLFFGGLGVQHGELAERSTLLICEGELNCASIWQVTQRWGWDVLSLGSESARMTQAMIGYVKRYGTVIAWFDKAERAREQARRIGAYAIASPGGQDANDLLRAGRLGGFLATVRSRACRDESERRRWLWDLWDAKELCGLDAGAEQVMQAMATKLGVEI
jgi:hypothetical protein